MKGIRTAAVTATLVVLTGCGGGPGFGIASFGGGCKALGPDASEFEGVDWTQVRQVNLRVRNGEYTPALVRLYQDKPYVFRIENRDDSTRRFEAGAFFGEAKLHSIQSNVRTIDARCPSGLSIEPREAMEIRFIAGRDGRYEFDNTAVPLPFAMAPSGVILIEEPPAVAALLQAPSIAPPDIPTTPYEAKPESATPPAATPAAVTPPGAPPAPTPPIAPAAPVEIQKAPQEGAPAIPGEAPPSDAPAAPQGSLPMLPMIPAPEPAPGAAPAETPPTQSPDARAPQEQTPGPLEMVRPPDKDSAVPAPGGLPMIPAPAPRPEKDSPAPGQPGYVPPSVPETTPPAPQGAAPAESMPELPPGMAPSEEPNPAEKSEGAPSPLPAPTEAVTSPPDEELPAMTATGRGMAPVEVLPPADAKANEPLVPSIAAPAEPAPPPAPKAETAPSPLPSVEQKATEIPTRRPDVAEAAPRSRTSSPFSRFLGRVGALYGD